MYIMVGFLAKETADASMCEKKQADQPVRSVVSAVTCDLTGLLYDHLALS